MQESKQSNQLVLSLIVPCYNVAPWIDRLLESVAKQTLTNFEIIAVDDGSTDTTNERLVEWSKKDPRLRVYHQQNSGAWQARVVGITQAQTDWITFADGDDVLLPTHLQNLWSGVANNVGVVVGGIRSISHNGVARDYGPSAGVKTAETALIEFLIGHYSNGMYPFWNKLYRRSLLMESGLEGQNIYYLDDQIVNLRVLHAAHEKGLSVVGKPTPTYVYISRAGSLMRSMSKEFVEDFFLLWAERERYATLVLPTGDERWRSFAEMRRINVWDFSGNLARMGTRTLRRYFKSRIDELGWPMRPRWWDFHGLLRWIKWHYRMMV